MRRKHSTSIRIGILGGGQLAKMSAQAAIRLGIDVAIVEKSKESPAGKLTHHEHIGWVDDNALLKRVAGECTIITLENEFIDHHRLEALEKLSVPVIPSSKTICLIQDKLLQKETLARQRIVVPRFLPVGSEIAFSTVAAALGTPFVLKSRKMGYDGYGNAVVKNEKDFEAGKKRLSARHSELMAEEFIEFSMELAVMVVRSKKEIKTYPVVQTIQKDHICHTVIAPAPVSSVILARAQKIAIQAVKAVNGYGIYGVELFLRGKDVIVNEMAPRPHNSGHYTIEGCVTSQFENHIRAVLGLPLGSTAMVKQYAVMINLLGKRSPSTLNARYRFGLSDPDVHLHVYGKKDSRPGRKMGHLTMVGDDLRKILRRLHSLEKKIRL